MKWIATVLICAASLSAQDARPYRLNNDTMGESVDEFLHNHPTCRLVGDPVPSRVKPRQTERSVFCQSFDEPDIKTFDELRAQDLVKDPDTTYRGIALETRTATFLSEDGLVFWGMWFRRSDYARLKMELLKEFGLPVPWKDIVSWNNDVSGIDLQEEVLPFNNISSLILEQDEYVRQRIITGALRKTAVE